MNNYPYMPNGTQPMGYPMSNFGMNTMPNYLQTQQPVNTNEIYVNGIEDVRNRMLAPNSEIIFLDNDKPILYQKKTDANGKFEIQAFSISPYNTQEPEKKEEPIDLSGYVKTTDLDGIIKRITTLENRFVPKQNIEK